MRAATARYIVEYENPNGARGWEVLETVPDYVTDKVRVALAERNATDARGAHWVVRSVQRQVP